MRVDSKSIQSLLLAALGLLCAGISAWGWRRVRRVPGRQRIMRGIGAGVLSLLAVLLIGSGCVWYWYYHRPIPDDIHQKPLFQGITYTRDARSDPRPLVIHVLTVDLDAPGIEFFVTPGEPIEGHQLPARKTSRFLDDFDLQVAINGSFFEPWWFNMPWDYYPHPGDPVNVIGLSSSQGDIYAPEPDSFPILYISADNQVSIDVLPDTIYNALAGSVILLERGEIPSGWPDGGFYTTLHPRTAVGTDQRGETFILVVVDGRQPNYSEGVTMTEMAEIMREFGCYDALNLDGGGSTTMAVEGSSGQPQVLNSPIDNHIPGRERPVANHLGIWAHPLRE
jgi:hypothetical protein